MYMIFTNSQRPAARALAAVVQCNPFTAERIVLERKALGSAFSGVRSVWDASTHADGGQSNLAALAALSMSLCEHARERLINDATPGEDELSVYEDLASYTLYARHHDAIERHIQDAHAGRALMKLAATYTAFAADLERLFAPLGHRLLVPDPAHAFAISFQLRRAFELIFHQIIGVSPAVAALRASAWQSIFTHDFRRYRLRLYDRMADVTTLVLGESGTGKELVARAIAMSQYVPFDARAGKFSCDFAYTFTPLNLSALPEPLVESELFGHRRGAFTGAVADRVGRLASCSPFGTVFLDEVGELSPAIQVKLLRVLQTRCFERLGDARSLRFKGKIVAATHRDLAAADSPMRRDLFYRLHADVILTPPLRTQLDGASDRGDELRRLVLSIATRLLPEEREQLADESIASIHRQLGDDYGWPGNFRELEQCVRNVLIRGTCRPPVTAVAKDADWLAQAQAGSLNAESLLAAYAAHVYRQEGTYERAGARLKLDRRTVRAYVAGVEK